MDVQWTDGFTIAVRIEQGAVILSANRAGLLSLARQMADMAEMPSGTHLHLDEYNGLEDHSAEIIIEKID